MPDFGLAVVWELVAGPELRCEVTPRNFHRSCLVNNWRIPWNTWGHYRLKVKRESRCLIRDSHQGFWQYRIAFGRNWGLTPRLHHISYTCQ